MLHNWFEQIFRLLLEWKEQSNRNHQKFVMIIDDLKAAIAANTAATNALVTAYQTQTVPASDVSAAISQINANTAAITAVLPPAPAPSTPAAPASPATT